MPALLDIIYSSDASPAAPDFLGYAFQGSDLVISAEGYADFIAAGHDFLRDSDGCYLHVHPLASGERLFSTDFHGYFPLFYYRHDTHWLVSPSFEVLARAAHQRGLPLTLRDHQLQAWSSPAPLTQMPVSACTPFNEIDMLSYDQEIITGPSGLRLRQRRRNVSADSYADALAGLIATWGGRILTILDGGMAIRADLSGGVDSRTVLAVIYWTLQSAGRLDLLSSDSIFVNSHPGMIGDYEVASSISQKLGFPLNNPQRRPYVMASDDEAFATWKQYNLARYSPHILPLTTLDSAIVTFNGVGGEEHRPFYERFGRGSLGQYIAAYRATFPDMLAFGRWMGDLHEDIDLPVPPYDHRMPASIRHYRRHRSRHHTAKQPVNEFMGVILGSRVAYDCVSFLEPAAVQANQFLFDIMINCHETLARMPYDLPEKAPQPTNFAGLTRLHALEPPVSGRIWRRPAVPAKATPKGRNLPLRAAVEAALCRREVRDLMGAALVDSARAQLDRLTPNNNLHQNGHLLHYALLVDVVSRYRSA